MQLERNTGADSAQTIIHPDGQLQPGCNLLHLNGWHLCWQDSVNLHGIHQG
jgi:hypothetical protein